MKYALSKLPIFSENSHIPSCKCVFNYKPEVWFVPSQCGH